MKKNIHFTILFFAQLFNGQETRNKLDSTFIYPVMVCKHHKTIMQTEFNHLDDIDIYSKDNSTQLIEGSGFIINRNKKIGSIGYSIAITKNKDDKLIRILKSESDHYKKSKRKP